MLAGLAQDEDEAAMAPTKEGGRTGLPGLAAGKGTGPDLRPPATSLVDVDPWDVLFEAMVEEPGHGDAAGGKAADRLQGGEVRGRRARLGKAGRTPREP